MRTIIVVALSLFLAGCPSMPRAPVGALEQIEAIELSAQAAGASITNLTCTVYVAKKCVEPGKAFDANEGIKHHDTVQSVRSALKAATAIGSGKVGDCLGVQRTQAACIAVAQLILTELERKVLQAQQGVKP